MDDMRYASPVTVGVVLGSSVDEAGVVSHTLEVSGNSESSDDQVWGDGWVWRPRDPEDVDGDTQGTEAVALRHGGRLIPVGYHDARLSSAYPSDAGPGSMIRSHWGGGWMGFRDSTAKRTRFTVYIPTASGVSAIDIDPDADTITTSHGSGSVVRMSGSRRIEMRTSDDVYIDQTTTATRIVSDGTVTVESPDVRLGAGGGKVATVGALVNMQVNAAQAAAIVALAASGGVPPTTVPIGGRIATGVAGVTAG